MKLFRFGSLSAILTAGVLSTCNSQATIYSFDATLTGPNESPANASPGTGFGTFDFDTGANTLTINMSWSGLVGTTTASHIHAATSSPGTGTAGVATTLPYFAGFPIGVSSGTFSSVLDLTLSSSYNSAFVTANGGTTASAETALLTAMMNDEAYINIHSTAFPGGEIRGFLQLVPEPSSFALLGLGAAVPLFRRYVAKRNS